MQDKVIAKKKEQTLITEIEFKRTSNIFINAGIVALYQYLKDCKEDKIFGYDYSFSLSKNSLHLKSDNLFMLLEDVYYYMGNELYDTSGKKARITADKYFFKNNPFEFNGFFKMKTYGLGALITNDPQPSPKNQENAITFENLVMAEPAFAKAIAKIYNEKELKLKNYKLNSNSIKKFLEDGRTTSKKLISEGKQFDQFLKYEINNEKILRNQLNSITEREEIRNVFFERDELLESLKEQIVKPLEYIDSIENKDGLLLSLINEILKVEGYFKVEGEKGDSKIFLNEPYIKITRLEQPKSEYFLKGNQVCYLTNESYKKLVDSQNTSPFNKGLNNFNSSLSPQSLKISWKAMYLSRFSPKLNLYTYVSGLDSIVCYFFDSSNLENLNSLYQQNKTIYKDSIQMIESNYMSNFKVHSFFNREEKLVDPLDFTGKDETLFALIYTVYKRFLYERGFEEIGEVDNLFDLGFEKIPISLVSFKADSFSSTLRPNAFEYFNNFKYVIRLIIYLEKCELKFSEVLSSLKFTPMSAPKDKNKRKQVTRIYRETVLGKILDGKSILTEISNLYFKCFSYLISGNPDRIKNVGYKNFKQLFLFISKYELKINKKMTQEMQEKAFKLGSSIGMAIVNFDNPENGNDKKSNAKNGRKYIIDLNKARTLDQFNDAIIRIMNKYHLQVNSELFKENLSDENFSLIKQFAIIGALNVINNTIKPIN